MEKEMKTLFVKYLGTFPEDAEKLAELFKVNKKSLAAYKAHVTMGRYKQQE